MFSHLTTPESFKLVCSIEYHIGYVTQSHWRAHNLTVYYIHVFTMF